MLISLSSRRAAVRCAQRGDWLRTGSRNRSGFGRVNDHGVFELVGRLDRSVLFLNLLLMSVVAIPSLRRSCRRICSPVMAILAAPRWCTPPSCSRCLLDSRCSAPLNDQSAQAPPRVSSDFFESHARFQVSSRAASECPRPRLSLQEARKQR